MQSKKAWWWRHGSGCEPWTTFDELPISIHNDCPTLSRQCFSLSLISHIWAFPLASTASPWCWAVLQGPVPSWHGWGMGNGGLASDRLSCCLCTACVSASGDCLCLTLAASILSCLQTRYSWALSSALATHAPSVYCVLRQAESVPYSLGLKHTSEWLCSFQRTLF